MIDLDTIRLGTDADIPIAGAFAVTPAGDCPTASGRLNLAAAIKRRMATEPGALVHRPTYGCGLLSRIGQANSPAGRADLAVSVRRNLLQDARIKDAEVSVALGDAASSVVVTVTLTLRDDSRSTLTFTAAR